MIILGGLLGIWSCQVIGHIATRFEAHSLPELLTYAGGQRLERFFSMLIILSRFGVAIALQIIITQLFKYLMQQIGGGADDFSYDNKLSSVYQAVPTAIFVLFPMCLIKDMSGFRYISLFTFAALLYIIVLYLVQLPASYEYFKSRSDIKAAKFDLNIFPGSTQCIFGYAIQVNILQVYTEMQRASFSRFKKMINRSILIDMAFYVTISMAAYLSNFSFVDPIFLKKQFPPDLGYSHSLTVAIIAIIVSLTVALPVSFQAPRYELGKMVFGTKNMSFKQMAVLALIYISSTCYVSIIFPNVTQVISIIAGLITATNNFGIPIILLLRVKTIRRMTTIRRKSLGLGAFPYDAIMQYKKPFISTKLHKYLAIGTFGFFLLTSYTAVIIVFYEIVNGLEKMPSNGWEI